jgi:PAS domain S-box-containing protein
LRHDTAFSFNRLKSHLNLGQTLKLITCAEKMGAYSRTEMNTQDASHRTEQRHQALQAGLNLIDQGFTLINEQLQLIAWNQAFLRLLDFPQSMGYVGAPFESFMRYNAERGEYGPGNADELVCERVQAASTFQAHDIVRVRPNGTALRVRGFPVPGHGFVTLYSDITEQRQAEETIRQQNAELENRVAERTAKLHRSEQQMRLITDSIPALIAYFDSNKVYRYINRGYQEWFGLDPANPDKVSAREYLGPEVYRGIRGNVAQALAGSPVTYEYDLVTLDGAARVARTTLIPDQTSEGVVAGCFELTFDITEQRRTQAMLVQAEKMDALGQLTGGLAHDFNNILTVIIGNLEGLRTELRASTEPSDLADEFVTPALTAAKRGTELIRGLMTFSRRQPLQSQAVEMNSAIDAICRLVKRSLPERISLTHDKPGAPAWALVDASQLENALVNLIMNARDAIEKSGAIHLALGCEPLDEATAARRGVKPGEFVRIQVKDSGCGMDEHTASRVFEPFFTTKPLGKGTGLGMAMVYGYIKQSGGFIEVDTALGKGTTISLWLPATKPAMDVIDVDELLHPAPSLPRGLAVLVEDDAQVRQVVRRNLVEMGYSVLEAETADDAKQIISHTPDIQLLISDIVMPGELNGRDLAHFARDNALASHIVLMTGYAPGEMGQTDLPTIAKPFSKKQLFEFLNKLTS